MEEVETGSRRDEVKLGTASLRFNWLKTLRCYTLHFGWHELLHCEPGLDYIRCAKCGHEWTEST